MTNRLYAYDLTGTAHEVAESKPTAGVGLNVLGRCGHMFLARRVSNEAPSQSQFCCGCRGEIEKETRCIENAATSAGISTGHMESPCCSSSAENAGEPLPIEK